VIPVDAQRTVFKKPNVRIAAICVREGVCIMGMLKTIKNIVIAKKSY